MYYTVIFPGDFTLIYWQHLPLILVNIIQYKLNVQYKINYKPLHLYLTDTFIQSHLQLRQVESSGPSHGSLEVLQFELTTFCAVALTNESSLACADSTTSAFVSTHTKRWISVIFHIKKFVLVHKHKLNTGYKMNPLICRSLSIQRASLPFSHLPKMLDIQLYVFWYFTVNQCATLISQLFTV